MRRHAAWRRRSARDVGRRATRARCRLWRLVQRPRHERSIGEDRRTRLVRNGRARSASVRRRYRLGVARLASDEGELAVRSSLKFGLSICFDATAPFFTKPRKKGNFLGTATSRNARTASTLGTPESEEPAMSLSANSGRTDLVTQSCRSTPLATLNWRNVAHRLNASSARDGSASCGQWILQ